ncbi:MAG: hypothetical protein PVG32_20550, partial [Anaerolineales bacterium]
MITIFSGKNSKYQSICYRVNRFDQDGRFEYRWVLFYSIVLMLFTTLPYLIGYISQGEDWYFTGFLFGVDDG